jgi:hypothetical protein
LLAANKPLLVRNLTGQPTLEMGVFAWSISGTRYGFVCGDSSVGKSKSPVAWITLVENLTSTYKNGDTSKVEWILNNMLATLTECIHYRSIDPVLVRALYRLCDFFCLEGRAADAERLCLIILHAQKRVLPDNDPSITGTCARLERVRCLASFPEPVIRPCRPTLEKAS